MNDADSLRISITEIVNDLENDPEALARYVATNGPLEVDTGLTYGQEMGAWPVGSQKADIMRLVARNVLGDRWDYRVEEIVGGDVVLMIGRQR
ncbi:hypothetical protein [Azospirillum sp. TSO5]|uniref:hypothetical protein n=1 Tax=Azospirillum sp. TSO5 TaxID=716760 RepID=UPI000D61EC79|nr:hypothetical protein [Azospirillum sp. TSO5]PWC98009.1 hypothetical protein TSO5_03500 [Azospirillum sp. TSO5]